MGHEGMKSSLVSREAIADSVELMMRAHGYDALIGLAGCDKSLPGMLMVMARLNRPSVFLYGGTILPGRFQGRDVTIVDVYEGVGAHASGRMSDEELRELECVACPTRRLLRRAVHGQHDGVRGRGAGHGPARQRQPAGGRDGPRQASPPTPARPYWSASATTSSRVTSSRNRRWRTPSPSPPVPAASTNIFLHLPAIAHEAGLSLSFEEIEAVCHRTPHFVDLMPGGRYTAVDVYKVGGVPAILKALLEAGLLHGDCLTVTGKTHAENLADVPMPGEDQDVIRPMSDPIRPTGGLKMLQAATSPPRAASSRSPASHACNTAARPSASTAKRRAWPPLRSSESWRATW